MKTAAVSPRQIALAELRNAEKCLNAWRSKLAALEYRSPETLAKMDEARANIREIGENVAKLRSVVRLHRKAAHYARRALRQQEAAK